MTRQLIIADRVISDDSDAYVIAEIGHNHQGSLKTAIELFHAAKECGVSAAKLQKRDNRTLYTREMFDKPYDNENSFGATYGEHREALEFGKVEYEELQAEADRVKLAFFATAFDFKSADFLDAVYGNVPVVIALIAVLATALAFDFTNGFHDTANAVATSVSTRAMSPRSAVALAAILNFAGAFISLEVAATIASGIVEAGEITETIVFAGLIGAIAWNLITWFFGLLVLNRLRTSERWTTVTEQVEAQMVAPSPGPVGGVRPNRFEGAKTSTVVLVETEAMALAEPCGMRPLVAHCHLGLGTLFQRQRQRERAREHLGNRRANFLLRLALALQDLPGVAHFEEAARRDFRPVQAERDLQVAVRLAWNRAGQVVEDSFGKAVVMRDAVRRGKVALPLGPGDPELEALKNALAS